jgi:hypothetical protein
MRPFGVGQIVRVAEPSAIIASAVSLAPDRRPPRAIRAAFLKRMARPVRKGDFIWRCSVCFNVSGLRLIGFDFFNSLLARIAHPNPLLGHRFSLGLLKGRPDQANGGARQSSKDRAGEQGEHRSATRGGIQECGAVSSGISKPLAKALLGTICRSIGTQKQPRIAHSDIYLSRPLSSPGKGPDLMRSIRL